jgi:hypothetical protein
MIQELILKLGFEMSEDDFVSERNINDELLAMYDKDPFALLEHFITNCTEGNFRKLKNAIKEQ